MNYPLGETRCPHCRNTATHGTRGGCHNCGKVKHTSDGRVPSWFPRPSGHAKATGGGRGSVVIATNLTQSSRE